MKIEIKNLKKVFGTKTAVDIEKADIHDGEILGLVGNNGAGKTTLFRLILDLLNADEGSVMLTPNMTDGTEPTHINPAMSEDWKPFTGSYIDSSFLIDFLTAEEYLEFVGKVSGMSKEDVHKEIAQYEMFMNGEVLGQKKYIRDFSAGNKQKVGIVAALLTRPQLVILDEPFNFLDPSSQNHLKKLLVEYNKTEGATILISSHNLQHTTDISTRITLLEHGVIIKDLDNKDGGAEKELEEYFNV